MSNFSDIHTSSRADGWALLVCSLVQGEASPAQAAEALESFAERLEQSGAESISPALADLTQANTRAEGARRIRAFAASLRSGRATVAADSPSEQAADPLSDPAAATDTSYTMVGGRVWAEMKPFEKHNLYADAPDTYAKLRAEHAIRETERSERSMLFTQARREGKLTKKLEAFWTGRPVAALREWLPIGTVVAEVRGQS